MEKYEECQNAINNESMENVNEINNAGEPHSSGKKIMAIDSFDHKDCNNVKTCHVSSRREKLLNNEFRQNEHGCLHYLGVTGTINQDSLETVSKNEPRTAVVNICTNELFTASHTGIDTSKNLHSCEKPIGRKTNCGNRKMEVVKNTGPVDLSCKYLEKRCLSAGKIKKRYDETGVYSTVVPQTLVCTTSGDERERFVTAGNSILQTGNLILPTGNSSLRTSDLSLQSGDNWTLNGSSTYGLSSNKKLSSDDGLCCRICHSVTDLETLVSPCLCTGSMKYVHESCLLNWLKSSVKTNCELCLHKVPVKKLIKPLREWRFEKPVPIIWLVSFIILFTLNILSVVKDASRGCTSTTCVVFYVLGCTGAILGVIFLWFWAKKCAVYFKKLLLLNQVWLLDEKYCKTGNKARTSALNCNI